MTRLFVSNLEHDASATSVRELFEVYGNVARIRMTAGGGATRATRFALVDMTDSDAGDAIRALHGSPRGAASLRVIRARAAKPASKEAAD
jgi:hypothetical protein